MRKLKHILLIFVSAIVLLTGCVPTHISEIQRAEVKEKGTELITSYLTETFDEFSISPINMAEAYGGSYGSNIAVSTFAVDGCRYNIYADISTSQIYVDYDSESLDEVFGKPIRDMFERGGIDADFTIYSYTADNMIASENNCERDKVIEPVSINIGTAIPVNMSEDEARRYIVENVENAELYVYYTGDISGDSILDMDFDLYEGLNIKGNIHLINISESDYAYYKENDEFFVMDIVSVRESMDIEHGDDGYIVQYDLMDIYQEDKVCINYVRTRKTFNSVDKSSDVIDYDCPASVYDDTIKLYSENNECPYAYVYYTEIPRQYSVSVVEKSGDGSETKVRVPLVQDPNGYYILYDKLGNQPAYTSRFSSSVTISAR